MSIIVMSDDDFEKNMQTIARHFGQALADSFKHRENTQREALARVEAERDAERARGDAAVGDANEAEAHLAEAVELGKALHSACVNLLYGGYDRITELGGDCDPVSKMEAENPAMQEWKAFLARHAQAEQQEARAALATQPAVPAEVERLSSENAELKASVERLEATVQDERQLRAKVGRIAHYLNEFASGRSTFSRIQEINDAIQGVPNGN